MSWIILIWILNFIISWANAWGCGKTWNESKANGGFPHFMNWMGAIMSACGFTWCYLVIACFLGGNITHEVNGKMVTWLSMAQVQAVANAGYLVIIVPILGSGLAITIHSWGVFWRRRSFGSGAIAGWNTFAQVYNMYNAASAIPGASRGLGKFWGDSDDKGKLIVLFLVLFAVLGGIMTTYTILTTTARRTAADRALKYSSARVA